MKTKTVCVCLLALLMGFSVGMNCNLYAQNCPPPDMGWGGPNDMEPKPMKGGRGEMGPGPRGGDDLSFFLNILSITDEQKTKVESASVIKFDDLKTLDKAVRDKEMALDKLVIAGDSTEEAIHTAAGEIGTAMAEFAVKKALLFKNIVAVLTDEQKTKYQAFLDEHAKMLERMRKMEEFKKNLNLTEEQKTKLAELQNQAWEYFTANKIAVDNAFFKKPGGQGGPGAQGNFNQQGMTPPAGPNPGGAVMGRPLINKMPPDEEGSALHFYMMANDANANGALSDEVKAKLNARLSEILKAEQIEIIKQFAAYLESQKTEAVQQIRK